MQIKEIRAAQILDSRGNPTLEVSVRVGEFWGTFSVPSGASTGIHEALELRDGGKAFGGQGVTKAIKNVEGPIAEAIIGKEADQKAIDGLLIALDGTENKRRLGANAILGVSAALCRAVANSQNLPLYEYLAKVNGTKKAEMALPTMFFNIVNGGKHAENNVDFQETMIVPLKGDAETKVRVASEVYHALKTVLISKKLSVGLGDEGGFAPDLESNAKALEVILEAIEKAGYKAGKDVALALDVAASELYKPDKDNKYILASENVALTSQQLVSLYKEMITIYPIVSIEDGLAEDDIEGWKMMTERIGAKVELVGDDLFVTNPTRIKAGIEGKYANAVLIKLNQIGTVSETLEAIRLAQKNGYKTMISHRSGETEDSFIADLAVATGAGQIKSGAPARGERTAKYNRLIEIEKELKK